MSRPITQMEIDVARLVFKDTLRYNKIYIGSGTGIGDAAYTTKGWSDYTLHLGSYSYNTPIYEWDFLQQATFIHELTHVWQGIHSWFSMGFMFSSLFSQGKALLLHRDRGYAYQYTLGKKWDDYNVEQQANIVEDWYYDGHMSQLDSRFLYVRDHIWTGRN